MAQLGPLEDLGQDVDYLYCPQCKLHIPCRRLDIKGWEVECPDCLGECGLCGCHLRKFCFSSRDDFPPLAVIEQAAVR